MSKIEDRLKVSDEEWAEWTAFLEEYNRKKKEKQDNSLLYWIFSQFNKKGDNNV